MDQLQPSTNADKLRECRISFLSWRHRYHGGPPVSGNGPEDTDSTPVVPCYYSPGLPEKVGLGKEGRTLAILIEGAKRISHLHTQGALGKRGVGHTDRFCWDGCAWGYM